MSAEGLLVRWGNELAVRIPDSVAQEAELKEGDRLMIEVEAQGSVAIRSVAARPNLDELISRITPENLHSEQWNDAPGGNERW